MDERFSTCLAEGKLVKIGLQQDLVQKEFDGAEFDLKTAQTSLSEKNHKWASVQAYYSMFHTAKALVLSKGYREKNHYCLRIALKALFIDIHLLESKYIERLRDSMNLREDADYGLIYSDNSAKEAVAWAAEFLQEAKKLIKGK